MNFVQTHSMGSDETAPYDVFDFQTNIKDFRDEVLTRNEWGRISMDIGGQVEYRYDKLLDESPPKWLEQEIVEVKAAGGWGSMDYYLRINPYNVKAITNEAKHICKCLTCKHCLPPSEREYGRMCKLNECKFQEA